MTDEITINDRGVLTIPAPLRRRLGLKGNDRLTVEATGEGLLLRPVFSVPIEIYADERIEEFTREEEAVGEVLDGITKQDA